MNGNSKLKVKKILLTKTAKIHINKILMLSFAMLASCMEYAPDDVSVVEEKPFDTTSENTSKDLFSSKAKPIMALEKIDVHFKGKLINLETVSEFSITGSSYKTASKYSGNFLRRTKQFSHLINSKDKHFFVEWKDTNGELKRFSVKSKNGVVNL